MALPMNIELQWLDEAIDMFDETYTTVLDQLAMIFEPPDHFTSWEKTTPEHETTTTERYTQLAAVAPEIFPSVTNALVLRAQGPARDQQLVVTEKR